MPKLPRSRQENNQAYRRYLGFGFFAQGRRVRFLNEKSERGSALMMAVFSVTLMMVIATEIMYESSVEYIVNAQGVNDLKAYYGAKAGVEMSLLRIHIYKKAQAALGDSLPDKSMLDPIWQLPFAWPPIVPEEASAVDKDQIQKSVKESNMQAQYLATIDSEGAKVDLNDLASPSKVVADGVKQQILNVFKSKLENPDDPFTEEYATYDFDRLVNNMADWVDENQESRNGGAEGALYPDIRNDFIPPNQPFKTLSELHMVASMTDAIYEVLAPRVTTFGTKGINVNYASKEVLMSLHTQITEDRAKKLIEDRDNPARGPFKDMADFENYLGTLGVQGQLFSDGKKEKVPLIFDAEYNFRIRSTGTAGQVTREIVAIVYDFDRVKTRLGELIEKEDQAKNGTPDPNAQQTGSQTPAGGTPGGQAGTDPNQQGKKDAKGPKIKPPKDRPNVVYWDET